MPNLMPPQRWPAARLAPGLLALTLACGPPAEIEPPTALPGRSPVEYPVELWDLGLEGEALLMIHVTAAGVVDSVYVDSTSGYPSFDSAAVRGARQLRFAPGRRGGDRAGMWTRLPVRFEREARGQANRAAPSEGEGPS